MRANKILVKQYREERNLKIIFIVDVGENMVFGSSEQLKCEYASEVVGAFANLIVSTGDKIGYVLFSDKIKDYVKPKSGMKHFYRFMEEITTPETYGGASNLKGVFDFAINYIPKSIDSVVIVSDFIDFNEDLKKDFSLISRKFETVLIMVKDQLDLTLPDVSGELVIEDPKTGQQLLLNPKLAKKVYEKYTLEQLNIFRKLSLQNGVDVLELVTNKRFVPTLAEFLKLRAKEGK